VASAEFVNEFNFASCHSNEICGTIQVLLVNHLSFISHSDCSVIYVPDLYMFLYRFNRARSSDSKTRHSLPLPDRAELFVLGHERASALRVSEAGHRHLIQTSNLQEDLRNRRLISVCTEIGEREICMMTIPYGAALKQSAVY
jgi:hypothetical protein